MYLAIADTTTDQTPTAAPDLVRIWASAKKTMADQLGYYLYGDGTVAVYRNRAEPILDLSQASALHDFWLQTAAKIKAQAARDGRNVSSIDRALADYAPAYASFLSTASNSLGGKLPIESTYQFMDATDEFVIALSAAQWAAYNNGTPWELLNQALDETTGGFLLKPFFYAAYGIAYVIDKSPEWSSALLGNLKAASDGTATILKIATYAAIGLGGYWVYIKARSFSK